MYLLRKFFFALGLTEPEFKYRFKDDRLYRMRYNWWGQIEWVQEPQSLNLVLQIFNYDPVTVSYTNYGNIGSKCMYIYSVTDGGCIYSSESILFKLDQDYKYLMGYFPKKLYFTKRL